MDFLCVGESVADIFVRPVKKAAFDNASERVDQVQISTGGDALNNAIILSKLGNSVAYVGRIGNDMFGQYVVEEGNRRGVDMSHAVVSEDTPHAKSIIFVNERGDRHFCYYPGTSAQFRFEDVDLSLLDECRILQIGGTFHLPAFDGDGAAGLLKEAKRHGVATCMDVTTDYSNRWDEIIRPCYPYLDYFLPSIEQAELIAGTPEVRRIAEFFLERGVKNVAVKIGKKGVYCRNAGRGFFMGAYDVPVVETTGAGDSFVGGFLTGVLRGFSFEQCAELGSAASAFAIQAVGATSGMRDYETVSQFVKLHKKGLEIHDDT